MSRKWQETLKVIITEDEKKQIGQDLAKLNLHVSDLERDKADIVKRFAADISSAKLDIDKKSTILFNGYDYRQVDVIAEENIKKKEVKDIRLDTGEIIRVRPMNEKELQNNLFVEDKEKR
jgi:hypothetical protein